MVRIYKIVIRCRETFVTHTEISNALLSRGLPQELLLPAQNSHKPTGMQNMPKVSSLSWTVCHDCGKEMGTTAQLVLKARKFHFLSCMLFIPRANNHPSENTPLEEF